MILSCHNLGISFGETSIIKNAAFGIEANEKAAIVGINGAGKSTLLKMIVGELSPSQGEVIIRKGASIGYLAQQDMLSGGLTIYEEMLEARSDIVEAEKKLRELEHSMKQQSGEALDDVMKSYHLLSEWFEQQDGYALSSEITGILKGLGFSADDFERKTDTLSGGQKTRVALGKLLLSSPDIILLDEPTNHLDMSSISWLEGYLMAYKGTVIVVAHDRYFLDRIVTKVIEIDKGTTRVFHGNYTYYADEKKKIRQAALKAYLNQQQEIQHQKDVIAKLRSFNREKSIRRAESREKLLDKTVMLEKPTEEATDMKLVLKPAITSGNDVLQVEHLRKAYDDLVLFDDLQITIRRGERVALIGDNGTGKTTILKIINGRVEADEGSVTLGTNVLIGYYDQEQQQLHPEKTLFDEISDTWPDMNNTRIRNVLAAFLFTGDDVFKLVRDLSGGERGRLSLARLMLSNANFLILDEPTNHLDMYSKEILEDALNDYSGTVLYVSHDRYFINRTATRILDLSGKTLTQYLGNYDYYLEKKEQENVIRTEAIPAGNTVTSSSREDWLQKKEEAARERKRISDLSRTEEEIASLESQNEEIDEQLTREEIFTNPARVTELSLQKAQLQKDLETLYERWEQLADPG